MDVVWATLGVIVAKAKGEACHLRERVTHVCVCVFTRYLYSLGIKVFRFVPGAGACCNVSCQIYVLRSL